MIALAPVRTVPPVEALLSVTDAKAHLRVDISDDDALIEGLIAAAAAHLDGYHGQIGKALLTQTWAQSFDGFPEPISCWGGLRKVPQSHFRLAIGPLQAVESVEYVDSDGVTQEFTDFSAVCDAIGPKVVLASGASWPSTALQPDAVTVTWRCGFGDAVADVPAAIIHAAKLLIGHWYDNRNEDSAGSAKGAPAAVSMLLDAYRTIGT